MRRGGGIGFADGILGDYVPCPVQPLANALFYRIFPNRQNFVCPACMCYTPDMDEQDINRRFEKLEHQNELLKNKWRAI